MKNKKGDSLPYLVPAIEGGGEEKHGGAATADGRRCAGAVATGGGAARVDGRRGAAVVATGGGRSALAAGGGLRALGQGREGQNENGPASPPVSCV